MNQAQLFQSGISGADRRQVMNGKPVYTVQVRTVINFESHFGVKKLCDGLAFSTGSACVYKCAFCYVPDLVRKLRVLPQYQHVKGDHADIVIRREHALDVMRSQLVDRFGRPKFNDPKDTRVIYASPLVDVAGNLELVRETVDACKLILELTHWQIRLLSKSNLLPRVAESLPASARSRVIYGVSTGTLNDGLARAFEEGTPLVSKRLASLHWLQDHGYRTFGMICPSLPQTDYGRFAREAAAAIRADRCEHVWAEALNARGDSMTRTIDALRNGGFAGEASALNAVRDRQAWEQYARDTFLAHAQTLPKGKLRFLQYVTPTSRTWWAGQTNRGAILL